MEQTQLRELAYLNLAEALEVFENLLFKFGSIEMGNLIGPYESNGVYALEREYNLFARKLVNKYELFDMAKKMFELMGFRGYKLQMKMLYRHGNYGVYKIRVSLFF